MSAVKYAGLGLSMMSLFVLVYAVYAYFFKMSKRIRKKNMGYMIRVIIEVLVFCFFGILLFIFG